MSDDGYAKILIIEFGSQYTLKIESSLRELGYRSAVLNPKRAEQWVKMHPVRAVILSGGFASVYDEDAPQPPLEIFSLQRPEGGHVPVLGICYGAQWIAKHFGGRVIAGKPGYGRSVIRTNGSGIFAGTPHEQVAWVSHGDYIMDLPVLAMSTARDAEDNCLEAFCDQVGHLYGVQFHPEVENTPHGKTILQNFLDIAKCVKDWDPYSIGLSVRESVLSELGKGEEVICGFSGGVDSSTLTGIVAPVLPNRFHPLAIDGGQLRENEMEEIRRNCKGVGMKLIEVEASERFLTALHGLVDAQKKRKLGFQPIYSALFQETARQISPNVRVILQGTLAPDEIESGATGGAVIKTHHNVGLDTGYLRQVHPFRKLFKYEVRALAKQFDFPESIWKRQPFPGPGLFIRYLWAPVTREGLAVVRWADARTTEVLRHHDIYDELSQLVVAYGAEPTVGVKGDGRVYKGMAMVRGVQTIDFMTAEGYAFEPAAQKEIARVLGKHPEIVHTGFFPTDKPPATTEFE